MKCNTCSSCSNKEAGVLYELSFYFYAFESIIHLERKKTAVVRRFFNAIFVCYLITSSPPINGLKTSGTVTEPSAF